MRNPWESLPKSSPYVLSGDVPAIEAFNRSATDAHAIRLECMPEPFLGSSDAPITLLNLNPGFSELEVRFHNDHTYFMSACRRNLLHQPLDYPFYLLDPKVSDSEGHKWWARRLKQPIRDAGLAQVASRILCIEYFPYHSKRFKPMKGILESQQYSIYLASSAVQRGALVIVMRGQRYWNTALRELDAYPQKHFLQSVQNVAISERNCPTGYPHIMKLLNS